MAASILFVSQTAFANGCPIDRKGFRGYDIDVKSSRLSIGDLEYEKIDDVIAKLSQAGRNCPVSIAPTDDPKDIELGAKVCKRIAALGFKRVVLHDPRYKRWTLYPPGVLCTLERLGIPNEHKKSET